MPKALPPSKINSVVNKLKEGKHHDVIHSETGPTTPCLVAQELTAINKVKVSGCAVHQQVRKEGIVPFVKPSKPALTSDHIKARLAFAKAHQFWTVEDWKHVQWSDETKINCFGSDGLHYAYKRVLNLTRSTRHTSMEGIDGNLNKELYVEILDDEFKQTLEYYGLDMEEVIFMQDNASAHKAKIVQDWFQEHGLEVFEWPANSPDLNPIENLWELIKRELYSYDTPASSMLELWTRVQEVWDKVTTQQCQDLIESMPRRIQACIKAGGGPHKVLILGCLCFLNPIGQNLSYDWHVIFFVTSPIQTCF
ncbi:hypothetical protein OPQ81_003917 [Rhizoctonia solani]|nr:hypothetical protein OPQ81_003917 [Rhizoctonia solani]